MPIPDRQSGPTPGAAGGSQSPGRPRADKPRVGSWTGRASASQLAGVRGVPHLDRSPGPKRPKSAAAAQPRAKAEAIGRDWPTPRLGRRSGATQQAGTDVALTRAAISGHYTSGRVRQSPGSGKSRWPYHYRVVSLQPQGRHRPELPQVCAGWTSPDHTQAKVESLSLPRTLTVIVTTAKKN